jgi:hypothetical protein
MSSTDEVLEKLRSIQRPSEHAPTTNDLAAWRTELENSVRHWDALIHQFKLKAHEAREKLKAVDILLGQSASPGATHVSNVPTLMLGSTKSEKDFTPVYEYWPAILESLVEFGGRAQRDKVITLVGEKLESKLTAADKQLLKSGMDVRWKNRVAWQRLNMVKQGLLRENSPRGIWEITDAGRQWLTSTTYSISALDLKEQLEQLCRKSAPNCDVKLIASPTLGHIRLRVIDGGVVILSPDSDIRVAEWCGKPEDQLWEFLESISNGRIRRPI